MKRLMPASLISFLANNRNCQKADLFLIVLPTGQTLAATTGQWDITVPSGTGGWSGITRTFSAVGNGVWSRGAITTEATFGLSANTMGLTCVPKAAIAYPGTSIGILNAALNGLFDAALVSVYTAYMPHDGYGNVSNGIETKFSGMITKITKISRLSVEFDCADALMLLNLKVPTRLLQANCMWGFCDSNCSLDINTYTQAFTAQAGSSQVALSPVTPFTQADGWATQGVVKCTAGANKGLSQTVQNHTGGVLQLLAPFLLPVAPGDTFTVIAGCDKTLTACKKRQTAAGAAVDNSLYFGGMPFMDPPTAALG